MIDIHVVFSKKGASVNFQVGYWLTFIIQLSVSIFTKSITCKMVINHNLSSKVPPPWQRQSRQVIPPRVCRIRA